MGATSFSFFDNIHGTMYKSLIAAYAYAYSLIRLPAAVGLGAAFGASYSYAVRRKDRDLTVALANFSRYQEDPELFSIKALCIDTCYK